MLLFRGNASVRWMALVALSFAVSSNLQAQTGTLSGRVTDSVSGRPLSGATVRLYGSDATTRQSGAVTRSDGTFSVGGLAPGTYRVSITFIGFAPFERNDVRIDAGGSTTLNATLAPGSLGFEEVVVSASRRPEKITSAPASVSVVDARSVQEQPALSTVEHLKGVTGLDIVQSGLTQSNIVARGFNNAASGAMMMMVDNRIASVPSLRLNAHNFIPLVNEDIQQIEVIRGPGSALYGPNTANGVLHFITRSPFSSAGTWLSVAGGERGVFQGMARHAGTLGDRFGYKVSAQYMRGEDWSYVDSTELRARTAFLADSGNIGVDPDTLKIGLRDSTIERVAGEVRLDYMPTDDLTIIAAVGANRAIKNPDITGVGAAQARDWQYTYYQTRLLYKDLFVQAFLNRSDAGETYLLRTGQPIVDRSSLFVAQAQHSTTFEGVGRLAYGVDYLLTVPVTDSTITGGNEEDDDIAEVGAYLQAEANLIPDALDLVLAGRLDKHSRLDDLIFSPRAALVWTPMPYQTLRLTYNSAYSAPSTNDLFLDIVAERTVLFDVRASGVPRGGFHFEIDPGSVGGARAYGYWGENPGNQTTQDIVNSAWSALQALVRGTGLGSIDSVAPPTAGMVELRSLNSSTATFEAGGVVADRPAIRPTINSTIELGYKGVIGERFGVSVDLYRSHYRDFVGPLQSITPNLFFNKDQLQTYLREKLQALNPGDSLTASIYAAVLADTASKVPLGVISPIEATDRRATLFSARNYGDITLYGVDIGWQLGVTDDVTLSGSLSWVSDNFFENLDSISDLALNAPKFKYSLAAEYRSNELGLNGEVRFRHVDGFPVNSGVFIGDVPGYSVVDLNVGYRLPFTEGLNLSLSAQNLLTFVQGGDESPFTQRHVEFVGTPALGRLLLARLTYEFR